MLSHNHKSPTAAEVVEEVKRMGDIGFPIAATSLMGYLKNMLLVVCMGRLGSLELAGGALAIGFTNITGYSVLSGLAMGMEPLCSQAFGSRNLTLLHHTLHRAILILLLASLPIAFLWLNLHPLMLSLRQDPDVARLAALYCRFALPDLLANSFLHPLRIYLRTQGSTWPLMSSTLLAIILHVPILFLSTFYFKLGIPGIALSSFLSNFNTLLFLLLYIYINPLPSKNHIDLSTPLLSNPALGWGTLVRFSAQSCLGVCLEWWWYELMTILAGYLYNPRVALATAGIVIQTTSLMYTLPTALSASVSTRVGNELGAGRPEKAWLSTVVAIGLALGSSVVGLVWTTVGRERWGRVFTSEREVLELSMVVLPIIGVCELANCPQTTSCGILRGSARPGIGAAINLYSFYFVGAPVGLLLGFVWGMGFVGLCYGLLAAQVACVVSILIVVYRTDWERESLKATTLVGIKTTNDSSCHDEPLKSQQSLV